MAITLNLQGIDSMLSQQRKKSIQFKTANQAMKAMDKFVPRSNMQKQNRLRTATHVSDDGHSIIYTMPYAKAQFFGIINGSTIKNYTTPGTSARWDKRLIGDKALLKTVTDVYPRELLKYGST